MAFYGLRRMRLNDSGQQRHRRCLCRQIQGISMLPVLISFAASGKVRDGPDDQQGQHDVQDDEQL